MPMIQDPLSLSKLLYDYVRKDDLLDEDNRLRMLLRHYAKQEPDYSSDIMGLAGLLNYPSQFLPKHLAGKVFELKFKPGQKVGPKTVRDIIYVPDKEKLSQLLNPPPGAKPVITKEEIDTIWNIRKGWLESNVDRPLKRFESIENQIFKNSPRYLEEQTNRIEWLPK